MSAKWMSVFSVDPGVTTGWSWALVSIEELRNWGPSGALHFSTQRGQLVGGQINYGGDENRQVARLVWLWGKAMQSAVLGKGGSCRDQTETVLLTEDFVVRSFNSSRSFLAPVRINSKLDWLVNQGHIDCDVFASYSPADAKSVCTDNRMKTWGLWSSSVHEVDSLRHLVLHLRKAM